MLKLIRNICKMLKLIRDICKMLKTYVLSDKLQGVR